MSRIPIYTKSDRKGTILAGEMVHLGTISILVKKVNSTKHKMRMFEGYGLQDDVYRGYVKEMDGFVSLHETDTSKFLVSPMQSWVEHGVSRTFNEADGSQRFLSCKYMAEFDNEDSAIDHMKRTYVAKPVKQTTMARLG